jgi:hypothetical protein
MEGQVIPERAPAIEDRTVPLRRPNSDLRSREYLTLAEVEKLVEAGEGQPERASRLYDDLIGFQAWSTSGRACVAALGAS